MLPGATPTKGRLLVATPTMLDLNFNRTVVYMLEHNDHGAVGVILNRPTGIPLHEPIDRWNSLSAKPTGLFQGGPVEIDALIAVALAADPLEESVEHLSPISGRVVSIDLTADPILIPAPIEAVRVFQGYAGWGAGQLEGEIEEGLWIIVDAQPDDVFATEPEGLWRNVLRRQPGRLAWLANAPDDLSLN